MVKLDYLPVEAEAAKRAGGKVIPFPARRSRGLLKQLAQQAANTDDGEQYLRTAICRRGHYLAQLGVARELVESEMHTMQWLLLGCVSGQDGIGTKQKRKPRRQPATSYSDADEKRRA